MSMRRKIELFAGLLAMASLEYEHVERVEAELLKPPSGYFNNKYASKSNSRPSMSKSAKSARRKKNKAARKARKRK